MGTAFLKAHRGALAACLLALAAAGDVWAHNQDGTHALHQAAVSWCQFLDPSRAGRTACASAEADKCAPGVTCDGPGGACHTHSHAVLTGWDRAACEAQRNPPPPPVTEPPPPPPPPTPPDDTHPPDFWRPYYDDHD